MLWKTIAIRSNSHTKAMMADLPIIGSNASALAHINLIVVSTSDLFGFLNILFNFQ